MSYPPPKNWFMVSYMPPWKTSLSYSVCKKAFYFSVLQIPAAAGLFPSFCHYLASRRLVPRFGSARGRRFCRFVPNTQLGTPLKNQWLEDMTFPSNMVPFFGTCSFSAGTTKLNGNNKQFEDGNGSRDLSRRFGMRIDFDVFFGSGGRSLRIFYPRFRGFWMLVKYSIDSRIHEMHDL